MNGPLTFGSLFAGIGWFRGLGNAVVPQVAEWIGRRIVAAHQHQSEASSP